MQKRRGILQTCLFVFLLLGLSFFVLSHAYAKDYYFGSDVSNANWSVSISKEVCALVQKIHDFGAAKISRAAGRQPVFQVTTFKPLSASTTGTISIVPPSWRHGIPPRNLGKVKIQAGRHILTLDAKRSEQVFAALESGLAIRVTYKVKAFDNENVILEVIPVKLRDANEQYRICLKKLLPYAFEDVATTDVYFKPNSEYLTTKATEKLDDLIRYIHSGARFTRIRVTGYADRSGRATQNRMLASKRSREVINYLKSRHITHSIIPMRPVLSREKGPKGRKVRVYLER